MTLDQILALVNAGFTKEDINNLTQVPNAPATQDSVTIEDKQPIEVAEPVKEEVPETPMKQDNFAEQLAELKSMIQMQNRKSVQIETPNIPTLEDITRELIS